MNKNELKMQFIMASLLLGAFFFTSGCATLITGTSQNIAISSKPPNAQVRVETVGGVEVASGETPFSVTLRRKDEYMVIISMPGYREARIQIRKEFNPIAILSAAAGLFGAFIDLATGAAWNLTPERIEVTLVEVTDSSHPEAMVTIIYEGGLKRVIEVPLVSNH